MSKVYKNILIRSDSSSKIGIGHIMRDLVLATQFSKSNVTFATLNLKGNINYKIIESGYNFEILKSNKEDELVKLIKKLNIDLLVIDHYKITYNMERYIKEKTSIKILSLDDYYAKHHCDILLNHNLGANKQKYKKLVPKHCDIRCGLKYTLIRDEFKRKKRKKRKKVNVFISIGGTDNFNLNIYILKTLAKFKNLEITLVTTSANINLKKLESYIADKKNIALHVDTNKIAKLMNKSDFAIVTPSVTLNEIIYLRVPFIAIKTMENQNEVYRYIKKDFLTLNMKNLATLEDKINIIINKYDYYVRQFKKGKYRGSK